MAGMTGAQLETRLANYLVAESKILINESYTIGGRTYTRTDLDEVRAGIKEINTQILNKSRGGVQAIGLTAI